MSVVEKFNGLNPTKKRNMVLAALGCAVLVLSWVYVSGGDSYQRKDRGSAQPYIKNPLTQGAADSLGVEALAGRLANMQSDVQALQNSSRSQQERHEAELEKMRQQSQRELADLTAKLREEQVASAAARKEMETAIATAAIQQRTEIVTITERGDGGASDTADYLSGDPSDISPVISDDWALFSDSADDALASEYDGESTDIEPSKIVTIGEVDKLFEDEEEVYEEPKIYIPAGSILTGTLLSGMDAPTGNSGRAQPFPSLLKIDQEAILPNRGRFDVTGCFLLAGGYGDLASERAYLRSEILSCQLADGRVIEATVDAYATGEDGKTGVRGRLVNRMGAVLANSLLAGFAGAAADIFTPKSVPVISSDPSASFLNNAQGSQAVASGLGGGASSTLDRLSEYYLSMAENTFPVVEVDAMRKVSFILVRGTNLAEKGSAASAQGAHAAQMSSRNQPVNNFTIP